MNWLDLHIQANVYELSVGGRTLARLEGGPTALLAGAGERQSELDIESAIERAEDWLMPSSKSWQGFALRVAGTQGWLRDRLGPHAAATPDQTERAFSGMVADMAFGRPIDSQDVADLVLLRELVHHGALSGILIE
jgi:hypothetical protein